MSQAVLLAVSLKEVLATISPFPAVNLTNLTGASLPHGASSRSEAPLTLGKFSRVQGISWYLFYPR